MNEQPQYRYLKGQYAEFNGYVFAYGRPTKIRDRATIEALNRREDYEKVEEQEAAPEPAAVAEPAQMGGSTCKHCGRWVKAGIYMHEKYCRG